MAAFPSYGKLLLGGFTENPASALIRTEMEGGLPKQTKVRARVMVSRTVSMQYTMAEFIAFKTWFRDTIHRGADWFDWTDPLDGLVKQVRIVAAEPPYNAQPTSFSEGAPLLWTVRFSLESWDA